MKVIHSWLKEYVGEALPKAEKVEELFNFHAFEVEDVEKVGDEDVIDVDVLPNRSSDCMSHRGIARELATLLKTSLENDPLQKEIKLSAGSKITIKIEDENLCSRFTAAVITGVKVSESPVWLKTKLETLGQRSINNVVDATNYVMYAIGQPTHAFDLDKLGKDDEGRANITIRNGKEGESLVLLSGEEIESNEKIMHLVDGHKDVLLDLAGIKGGKAAELTKDTTNIVVTSGHFNYQSVRKTAQRLRVITDASQRFQNQPSPELAGFGLEQTVELILKLAGGECDGMVDEYPRSRETVSTTVTLARVNNLLGLDLSSDEVEDILERVSFKVEKIEGGFIATTPWERNDLVIEEDYIEEVGRIHGLSNIKSVVPESVSLVEVNARQYYSEKIRQALMAVGFSEVITSSFLNKAKIQLQNALASDKSCVRNTLVKNISAVLDANYAHTDLLGLPDVRVFEVGTVFDKTETGVAEHLALTIGTRTKGNGYSSKDDKVLQEGLAAVGEILGDKLNWQIDKGIAELNLSLAIESLKVPEKYEPLPAREDAMYKSIVPYPAIARDIALWVTGGDDAEAIAESLVAASGPLLVRHTLFDTFTKEKRTSYAFRLVFQSPEKTLTDMEANEIMEKVNKVALEKGWEVR